MRQLLTRIVTLSVYLCMAACASINTLPEQYQNVADPDGFKDVRAFAFQKSDVLQQDYQLRVKQMVTKLTTNKPIFNVLAISGGGSFGAFSAGVLNGWTKRGDRPKFDTVTGISTGALIAPFAFLGPKYDDTIAKLYTTITTSDIISLKPPLLSILLGSQSLTSTDALKKLIEQYVTSDLVNEIAGTYYQGRRLFIGTTNLNAGKLVMWNMTKIAASKKPEKIALFRKILLASASIPVAMPPVYFDVIANNKHYLEMHVDGGTSSGVFIHGLALDKKAVLNLYANKYDPKINIYILRNNQFFPPYDSELTSLIPIARRAINTLTISQGIGDLMRIYLSCKQDGASFNLLAIPDDYHSNAKEIFDKEEMRQLYDMGYQMSIKGKRWMKSPPGLIHS